MTGGEDPSSNESRDRTGDFEEETTFRDSATQPPPTADPRSQSTRTEGPARKPAAEQPASIGRYRILSKLGEGGMGVVYEAEQQQPRRRVAIKVVRGGEFVDDSRLRMFQREAETLARLKHPNIATSYDSTRSSEAELHPDLLVAEHTADEDTGWRINRAQVFSSGSASSPMVPRVSMSR